MSSLIVPLCVCTFIFLPFNGFSENKLSHFNHEFDRFLKKYVSNGTVDYEAIKTNEHDIHHLTHQVSHMHLMLHSAAEKKAFYLNAYHVLLIHTVVSQYPNIEGISLQKRLTKDVYKVAGHNYTVSNLEKEVIAKKFNHDPRVHMVLNRGIMSCLPMNKNAYFPERLELQIDSMLYEYFNSPYIVRVKSSSKTIYLPYHLSRFEPSIMNMYKENIITFINRYRNPKLVPDQFKVSYFPEVWLLNDRKNLRKAFFGT